jgi:hypothetical protein
MLEDGNLLVRPGAVTRHRAVAEASEDRFAVSCDVVV